MSSTSATRPLDSLQFYLPADLGNLIAQKSPSQNPPAYWEKGVFSSCDYEENWHLVFKVEETARAVFCRAFCKDTYAAWKFTKPNQQAQAQVTLIALRELSEKKMSSVCDLEFIMQLINNIKNQTSAKSIPEGEIHEEVRELLAMPLDENLTTAANPSPPPSPPPSPTPAPATSTPVRANIPSTPVGGPSPQVSQRRQAPPLHRSAK